MADLREFLAKRVLFTLSEEKKEEKLAELIAAFEKEEIVHLDDLLALGVEDLGAFGFPLAIASKLKNAVLEAQQSASASIGQASASSSATGSAAVGDEPAAAAAAPPSDDELSENENGVVDVAPIENATPSFSGFLKKQGDKGFVGKRAYVKRHFRLFDSTKQLFYYKSDKDKKPIGRIELAGVMFAEPKKEKGSFAITMKTKARVYKLRADTDAARDEWVAKISAHTVAYTADKPVSTQVTRKRSTTVFPPDFAALGPTHTPAVKVDTRAHRSLAAVAADNRATLAELNELPLSKSIRYAEPEVSAVSFHPLAGKPGSSAVTIRSHGSPATVCSFAHATLDDNVSCTVDGLPHTALSDSFAVLSLTNPAAAVHDLMFRIVPRTPEELLIQGVGRELTVSLPRGSSSTGGYGAGADKSADLKVSGTVYYREEDGNRFMLGPKAGTNGEFHFLSTSDVVSFAPEAAPSFPDPYLRVSFDPKTVAPGDEHDLRVVYNVNKDSLSWHAAYTCVLDHAEGNAAFVGTYVVKNECGVSFSPNTELVFVAEARADNEDDDIETEGKSETDKAVEATTSIGSKFGGFGALASMASALGGGSKAKEVTVSRERIYTSPFHESHALANNVETQVAFADARISVRSFDLISFSAPKMVGKPQKSPAYATSADCSSGTAKTVVEFVNSAPEEGVGRLTLGNTPLPGGKVAISRMRADGLGADFICTGKIPHVALHDSVVLELDDLAGVSATRAQTGFNYDVDRDFIIESLEITVNNGRDEEIAVTIQESFTRWRFWEITSTSRPYTAHPNSTSKRIIRWTVPIAAGKQEKIAYTVFYNRFPPEDDE